MLAFAAAIFTGAFLVFQVQPVLARFILPWYGGTPSVWTTCMLFFQVGLLTGYIYAHTLARYLRLQQQVIVHGCLMLLSLLLLPIAPELPEFSQNLPQIFEILKVLAFSVGLPFIVLSASAPLLQHWFAHAHPGKSPFRLYALSNVGSLLALLSYPFVVEPALTLSTQARVWSCAYLAFIGVTLWCAWPVLKKQLHQDQKQSAAEAETQTGAFKRSTPGWLDRVSWLLLAACGSVVLLAVTNQMCQDVAVIPFLWILPLSLYLITFIICFERDAWYQRAIWLPFLACSVAFLVYYYADTGVSIACQIMMYCAALFGCCMVCHGELVRRRPTHSDLTMFYVCVALGGALGGVFVNLIAPLLFVGFWELQGSLVVVCVLATLFAALDRKAIRRLQRCLIATVGCICVGILIWFFLGHIFNQRDDTIFSKRSFFGLLRVNEKVKGEGLRFRSMYHGRIIHGVQWQNKGLSHKPTTYFGPDSGVARAFTRFTSKRDKRVAKKTMRVGVIGLGIGTLAAYGRPGDSFRFYEINPDVEYAAREYFSYLDDSKADIEVVIGDGRRTLQHELETQGSQQYDVLVVDAFSGDAVPVHLLTLEASDIYWKHLKDNGVLALNITNMHVDLSDVVRQMAIHAHKQAIYIEDSPPVMKAWFTSFSRWVLITSNQAFINERQIRTSQDDWDHELKPIIWTDDFSNLFEVVTW